mmetsp:Transcript_25898/g.37114  ORF Transcript_25898/g.37114 Transcript_25898/m.37114 type:complete len:84 (+) Transcript_25898:1893-2144(+)
MSDLRCFLGLFALAHRAALSCTCLASRQVKLLLGETPKDTNGAKAIVDPTVIAARRSFMMYLFYLMLNYYFEARLSSSFAAAR